MYSQRKRHLFLGLGLAVALVLAVSPATASGVSTLNGEALSGFEGSVQSIECGPGNNYTVSGNATGPYPGTVTESGAWGQALNATFTITSGTTTITGSKIGGTAPSGCGALAVAHLTGPYTVTIQTPNGNFHDEGTSVVQVQRIGSATTHVENFTSSLAQPVLIAPTNKDQCKNDGWKNFPQFKNQGQCVSFVERQPKT